MQLALMLCNILVTFYPLKCVCWSFVVSVLSPTTHVALLPQPKEPCFHWIPARQADTGLELEGITRCVLSTVSDDVKFTIITFLIQNGTRVVHGKFSSPVSELVLHSTVYMYIL